MIFNKNGMKIDSERAEAIKKRKNTKNKVELQKVLGMFNFLRKFIPNMSNLITLLRELLKKNVSWVWTNLHTKVLVKL